MNSNSIWYGLGLTAALLVAAASAAGALTDVVYARETLSWAAQGIGQDWANLLIVVPALLIATALAWRGSTRARVLWRGLLLYVIYSYVLYSFFIHFNRMFLVCVGALGCAFYALVGSMMSGGRGTITPGRRLRFAGSALIACALLFAALWLADVVPATLAGKAPESLEAVGLIVNPVHVLDLALVLPAMLVTGIMLWRGRALGYAIAGPLLIFGIAMGTAIEFMFVSMGQRGLPVPIAGAAMMAIMIVAQSAAAYSVLRHV